MYTFHKTGYLTDSSLPDLSIFDIIYLCKLFNKGAIMGQKKNVTFNDIAKYTNFSKTTISRYFNNPDSLTLENQ